MSKSLVAILLVLALLIGGLINTAAIAFAGGGYYPPSAYGYINEEGRYAVKIINADIVYLNGKTVCDPCR